MDVAEILLNLRKISGVNTEELDFLGKYIADQNSNLSALKVQILDRDKADKREKKLQTFTDAIAAAGLDRVAFKDLVNKNFLDFNALSFDAAGKMKYGDLLLADHLKAIPYLERALVIAPAKPDDKDTTDGHAADSTVTGQDPQPTDPATPPATPATPPMGTTTGGDRTPNPLDQLAKSGLFATP